MLLHLKIATIILICIADFNKTGGYNIPAIIQDRYDIAVKFIEIEEQEAMHFLKNVMITVS